MGLAFVGGFVLFVFWVGLWWVLTVGLWFGGVLCELFSIVIVIVLVICVWVYFGLLRVCWFDLCGFFVITVCLVCWWVWLGCLWF